MVRWPTFEWGSARNLSSRPSSYISSRDEGCNSVAAKIAEKVGMLLQHHDILRNVVANYSFETSRRFAGIQPNSGLPDYSRLSCGVGDTQLGAGFCGDLHGRWPSCGVADKARIGRDLFRSEDDRPAANQQHHCSVCAGLTAQRERVW